MRGRDRPRSVSTAPRCPISSFSSSVMAMFRRAAVDCSATPTSQLRESCHHQDMKVRVHRGRLTFSSASTPPNAMISLLKAVFSKARFRSIAEKMTLICTHTCTNKHTHTHTHTHTCSILLYHSAHRHRCHSQKLTRNSLKMKVKIDHTIHLTCINH